MKSTLTWYDNSICRPTKSDFYLVVTQNGSLYFLQYSTKYQAWNVTDDPGTEIKVSSWASLDSYPEVEK